MKRPSLFLMMAVLLLAVGWLAHSAYASYTLEDNTLRPINRPDPGNRITGDVVKVYEKKVVIDIPNVQWSKLAPSRSMEPFLGENAHTLEIKPLSSESIQPGDIISYSKDSIIIIHRVVNTGTDEHGWYATTKGDNLLFSDKEKVRFAQITGVVIGVLY